MMCSPHLADLPRLRLRHVGDVEADAGVGDAVLDDARLDHDVERPTWRSTAPARRAGRCW